MITNDLISRSALLADIEESVVFSVKAGQPSAEIRGANKITNRIKAAPAVDAVEVIRCKDCKFWRKDLPGCTDFVGCCNLAVYMVGATGYCVYGERRSDK